MREDRGAAGYDESDLRVALIRMLAKEHRRNDPVFAIEARYGFSDRRADVVLIDDFTHAFEIKSDFDTVKRLDEQASEYVSTFDFVTVVTTDHHLSKVRSIVPDRVGIIVFRDGELTRTRQARQNKRLSKYHLVAGVSKDSLAQHLPSTRKKYSRQELAAIAVDALSMFELREIFLQELRHRFSETSRQFLQETDSDILEEDLLFLRRVSRLSM